MYALEHTTTSHSQMTPIVAYKNVVILRKSAMNHLL